MLMITCVTRDEFELKESQFHRSTRNVRFVEFSNSRAIYEHMFRKICYHTESGKCVGDSNRVASG